jgi:hypothetical protein
VKRVGSKQMSASMEGNLPYKNDEFFEKYRLLFK